MYSLYVSPFLKKSREIQRKGTRTGAVHVPGSKPPLPNRLREHPIRVFLREWDIPAA